MTKISVIIPTYNRPVALEKCLDALVNQKVDDLQWEVVLVNDGGAPLEGLLTKYANSLRCIYVTQKNAGPASARNMGVEKANGQIVAFLDDDCIPDKTWIQEIFKHAKPGSIVGGKVVNLYKSNMFSEASQVLIDFLYDYNKERKDAFFTSNNFCLFRSDFIQLKGFSTSFQTSAGEDREFCVRAANAGIKLNYVAEMSIKHAHSLTMLSFCRLHKKYGFAAFNYQQATKEQNIELTNTPELSFYRKMLLYPFKESEYSFFQKVVLAFLLGVSQLFVAIGYYQNKF